jgi:hypothetical protein
VHHLVAEAFIGPMPPGQEVNHVDADKANNRAENLEYQTPSGNIFHAYRSGAKRPVVGVRHPSAVLTEGDVLEIRRLHALGFRVVS